LPYLQFFSTCSSAGHSPLPAFDLPDSYCDTQAALFPLPRRWR
jgi:hypothetical protein